MIKVTVNDHEINTPAVIVVSEQENDISVLTQGEFKASIVCEMITALIRSCGDSFPELVEVFPMLFARSLLLLQDGEEEEEEE